MIGWIILAVVAVFLAVLLIRAAMFKPKAQPAVSGEDVAVDVDNAVANLQKLVQCKTISYNDHALEDDAEFQKLLALLPQLYPHVFAACEYQQFPDRGILLRWPGKESGDPAVMIPTTMWCPWTKKSGKSLPLQELWKTVCCGAAALWIPRSPWHPACTPPMR